MRCSTIPGNALTGTIPASWAQLASLQQVTLQPGNPGLCPALPEGANFMLCDAVDKYCDSREQLASSSTECDALMSAHGTYPGEHGHDGGRAFPVAAVVVPLTFVAVAALAAAGLQWRRHRAAAARLRREVGPFASPGGRPSKEPVYQVGWLASG